MIKTFVPFFNSIISSAVTSFRLCSFNSNKSLIISLGRPKRIHLLLPAFNSSTTKIDLFVSIASRIFVLATDSRGLFSSMGVGTKVKTPMIFFPSLKESQRGPNKIYLINNRSVWQEGWPPKHLKHSDI